MADVKLSIAGRFYDVHCADGQENQLRHLASLVDAKARETQGGTEVRQLLFAALMLADEAQDANGKDDAPDPQSEALQAAITLAEGREAAAIADLRAAVAREQAALDTVNAANQREEAAVAALEQLRQRAETSAAKPRTAYDRALLQIADRIEALAAKIEQMP